MTYHLVVNVAPEGAGWVAACGTITPVPSPRGATTRCEDCDFMVAHQRELAEAQT